MRIADPRPVACSVCLQPPMISDPQPRYVDFEVAWDGPVLTHAGDDIRAETYTPTSIDDLYICESCLKSAAKLIGMEDAEEVRARIAELEDTVTEKDTEITEKDKAIASQNATIAHLFDTGVIQRHPGKRALAGPESHSEELKALRKDRVAKERSKKRSKATA